MTRRFTHGEKMLTVAQAQVYRAVGAALPKITDMAAEFIRLAVDADNDGEHEGQEIGGNAAQYGATEADLMAVWTRLPGWVIVRELGYLTATRTDTGPTSVLGLPSRAYPDEFGAALANL